MAGIARKNGHPLAGAFYGYTPLIVKIAKANAFTADVGGGTSEITEGGYSKGIKAVQTVASIVWASAIATDDDYMTVVVDQPSANQGDGVAGSGVTTGWGALKAALAAQVGGAAGDYTITSASTINSDGTITFA